MNNHPIKDQRQQQLQAYHAQHMHSGQECYFVLEGKELAVRSEIRHWVDVHHDKIAAMLALQPSDRFVDLGCGEGYFTLRLARRAGKCLGFDFTAAPLEVLRNQQVFDPQKVYLALASGDRLPLPASYADKLLCNHVLEHVIDDDAVMQEIFRVLRPHGLAVIGIPQTFSPQTRLLIQLRRRMMPKARELQLERAAPGELIPELIGKQSHIRFYSLQAVESLLERNGFEILQAQGIGLSLRGNLHKVFRRNYVLFHLSTFLGNYLPSLGDGLLVLARKRLK
ncbi:MAG TPA: class I SAM-dependent methyltransferase [Anaerolineales bacterium]